ncbi:MAG: outer membrane protein TolC [Candidatus Latescibacterota bacterium]|jgi:outer membrane protein TolC
MAGEKVMNMYIMILFVSVMLAHPAYGQKLEGYLALAAEQNPGLKSTFFAYQSSLQRIPQVGALPDPQFSLGYFLRPMEQMMGNQVAQISLMQMFPWFGTLDAAKDEASLMAKTKFNAFRDAKSSLFYEVKTTWYALYLIEEEHRIMGENLQIMQTLETLAINRFKSGGTDGSVSSTTGSSMNARTKTPASSGGMGMNTPTQVPKMGQSNSMASTMGGQGNGSLVDVLRIQMLIHELENKQHLLSDTRQTWVAQFNKLLNRPLETEVILSDPLPAVSLPVLLAQIPDSILENNAMLKMLEAEEEAFLAQAKMNRKMGFPMIGFGAQYGILKPRAGNANPMNGRDMWMPMISVSLPIWRNKYRASVKEAELKRAAVTEERRDTQNALMVSYEEALKKFRDAERRGALYEKQTMLAQQALNILTASYGAGGNEFEDVLQMQLKLLNYRLDQMNAIVDQNVSVAMLARLMGR